VTSKSTEMRVNTAMNNKLRCVAFFVIYKRHLIVFITKFYWINWNIMELRDNLKHLLNLI
jgi:hypothetical protein